MGAVGLSFDTLFSDADVSKTRVLLSDALSDRSGNRSVMGFIRPPFADYLLQISQNMQNMQISQSVQKVT